jgi:hypothetical protein
MLLLGCYLWRTMYETQTSSMYKVTPTDNATISTEHLLFFQPDRQKISFRLYQWEQQNFHIKATFCTILVDSQFVNLHNKRIVSTVASNHFFSLKSYIKLLIPNKQISHK